MNHLRGFSEIHKEDATFAGGKGASLGEMTNAGIPVPPGFVILASAFDTFLAETNISSDIEAILLHTHHDVMHEVESASEKIQEIVLSQELPQSLRDDILASFKSLGADYVAVRSSATAEDGAEHAWAGQLDSFLNTREATLLHNVKKCWASLFTPRAIFYRFEKGLAATHISVAVVVQKMVDSEYSGIAFSVHPVTEDRNQMIIEAGFGLGEAIVSGQVTPDSYVVTKSPRDVTDINVSEQSRALYRAMSDNASSSSEKANEWRELGKKGGTQVLMKEQIFELAEIVMRIENHYGFPCDIEWAYEAEKFYITQSRPITTLSPESSSPKEISLLHMYSAWSKNWESEFSLLASDIGLRVYHSFQDIYGASLSPIITHKQGVTSCFYADVELDAFTSHLWSLYTESPAILDIWIKEAQQRSDELALLSKQSDVVSLFSRFNTCVDAFGAPNFAIREITNPLDASGDAAALHKVTEYRKYTEMFYYNMDVFLKKLIQALTHTSGYEDGLIASLTLDELVLYIGGGILPEKHVLQQRRDASVAWWVSGTLTYYNGNIDEALSILHGTYDGSGRFTGVKAFGGKTRGTVKLITSYDSTVTIEPDNILVTGMTDPRFIHLMHIAKAFITDAGGMLSHAAIVARELKKPCIVGTKIATQVLKDGDVVEVDADNGIVRIIEGGGKNILTSGEKVSLSKLFTRERPLFYYYAFPDADRAGVQKYLGKDVEDILFIVQPQGVPGEVWYPQQAFDEISTYALEKINGDKELREKICRDLDAAWEQISPYFLLGKDIETQEESYVYYQYIIDFWAALNTFFFTLVDNSQLHPEFAAKLKSIRDTTQEYTAAMSEKFVSFFEKKFPEYAHVSYYITPKEARDVRAGDMKMLRTLEERAKIGCFVYRDALYLLSDLEKVADKYNFLLQQEEVVNQNIAEISGQVAYKGKITGTVKRISVRSDLAKVEAGDILVSPITDANFVPAMQRAAAFVTDEGGVMCHAAIVAREMKKPCIIGTKIATQVLKDGDLVEVDADNGIVRIIEIPKKGVSAKKELDKNHLSLSEWFADAGVGDQDAFRNEDNEKRERLKILHSIIGIPFDTPTQFLASDIKNKTPTFLTFLRDHGDEPCALRLIPTVEGLPKLRMRGQTIRNVTETWFNEQGIDVEKYRADFMPHSHESLWSTIFVVNEHGIFGEMVHGGHDQLTSGHYENATERYQFSYDFKTWSMAPYNEDALHHIQEVTMYVQVPDEAKQQRITHELDGVFYADYLGGYFESVLSKEFGLWFVDYNRILGSMYASMTLPTYVQSDSASIQGTVVYGKGVVQGTVVVLDASSDNLPDVSGISSPILVTAYTMPQHVPLMKQSVAIITNEGGLLSHASIISRELKKPCIIGTKIATQVLKDGDMVEVDAEKGVVRILDFNVEHRLEKMGVFKKDDWFEQGQWVQSPFVSTFFSHWHFSKIVGRIIPGITFSPHFTIEGSAFLPKKVGEIIADFIRNNLKEDMLGDVAQDVDHEGEAIVDKVETWLTKDDDYVKAHMGEFVALYKEFTAFWSAEVYIADQITRVAKEVGYITNDAELFAKVHPHLRKTWIEKEAGDMRVMARDYLERNDEKELSQKIADYIEKYRWIRIAKWHGSPIDEVYARDRLAEEVKNCKEGNYIESHEAKEQPDGVVALSVSAAYWRAECGRIEMQTSLRMRSILQIFADKLGITYEQILLLSPHEMVAVSEDRFDVKKLPDIFKREKNFFSSVDIDGEEILLDSSRSEYQKIKQLYLSFDKRASHDVLRGVGAAPGFIKGTVRIITSMKDSDTFLDGEILVAPETTPSFVPLMRKASAILTGRGGITSHAAIVSRELKKPCVIAIKDVTRILKNGDLVEVDAEKGVVRVIK